MIHLPVSGLPILPRRRIGPPEWRPLSPKLARFRASSQGLAIIHPGLDYPLVVNGSRLSMLLLL